MAAEAFIFFSGGFETGKTAFTYVLYELSLNQDIQLKLRTEIEDNLDKNGGELDTTCSIANIWISSSKKRPCCKKVTKEYNIPETNMTTPKKINILISIYSIHNNPENYPSPEVMAFLAFGERPKNCISEWFVSLQWKFAPVKLLTNFDFFLSSKKTMNFKPTGAFFAPIGGMTLWFWFCEKQKVFISIYYLTKFIQYSIASL